MDALDKARREIDAVDAELAALFERRMAAVLAVAQYKQAHGLPIFDAAREKVVLDKAEARIQDPALRPYYRDHVQNMMDVAKHYEAEVLGQNRAAYQGVEGAFAHIALKTLFPHAEAVSCPTWDEVFAAVERGDAAHGVVPFENSHAGDVSAVLDLCYNHPGLWVVDVYDLPISQNLLVLPGTQLAQLKHVYSHQQAIAQSETFLKQFRLPATAMPNTAMLVGLEARRGGADEGVRAGAQAHDDGVHIHGELAALLLDGAAAAGGVGFAQLHLHAGDGLDEAVVIGQNLHRVAQGLEDDAILLGVLHFLLTGGQLGHAAAVDDVDGLGTQTQGAAGSVHGHVAAAHNGDLLAGADGGLAGGQISLHQVGAGQELVGRVDALQALAGMPMKRGRPAPEPTNTDS